MPGLCTGGAGGGTFRQPLPLSQIRGRRLVLGGKAAVLTGGVDVDEGVLVLADQVFAGEEEDVSPAR